MSKDSFKKGQFAEFTAKQHVFSITLEPLALVISSHADKFTVFGKDFRYLWNWWSHPKPIEQNFILAAIFCVYVNIPSSQRPISLNSAKENQNYLHVNWVYWPFKFIWSKLCLKPTLCSAALFLYDSTSCSSSITGCVILDLIDLISEMIAGEKLFCVEVKKD